MKVSKLTSQKGITLVALIITIIVLLILAMVSIRLVMNGGIIDKANKGVNAYNDAEVKEKIQLAHSELEMAKFTNSNLDETQFLTERLEAQGLTGATVEATSDGWNITYNGKSYPLSKNGTVGDAVAVIDWDTVIVNAQKHPDQSSTNDDIGIDMYGNPVNMDLWDIEYNETDKTCATGKAMGSKRSVGYTGDIVDGKIIGEIPQYIKKNTDTYTLTRLAGTFTDNSNLVIAPKIPTTVQEMGGNTHDLGTFLNCSSLTIAPAIPNSVKNMKGTFSGCTSLTTAPIIPNSVTDMGGTFAGCTSLTTAPIIPNSVTDMSSTFSGCTSLTTAPIIPNSVTNMSCTFLDCTSLTTAPIIPNSVTDIGNTFSRCTSLTTAPIIPNSVTNMTATFKGCTSLTTAPIIPNSVTNISYTFADCTSLTTAPIIPNSVTNMNITFFGCTSLTGKLVINANAVSILYGCLLNAATNDGCNLVVSGSCPQLDDIIATKSSNSHITKGQ